ncbi:MAG: alpha/beta hydrolase [Proteobacteria bacterium]|nr:alpha/beta hydrolase [Pseudomonadota bacterium]
MAQLECLTLARGDLRFSARAIGRGPIALFLHGFPDTERTFDAQLQALAAAGFRAVAVRMRGYEPSSQPADQDYRGIRMAEDVLCWIDQLGGGPVHLIGHDWGAIIAQIVAAQAPGKVTSLTVMAVPRLKPFGKLVRDDRRQAWRSLYGAFFQIPRLPEWRINRANFAYLERLWRRWSPGWAIPPETLHEVRQAFAAPGVTRAALSYYRQARDTRSHDGKSTARLLRAPLRVPTLGLCGAADGCISADIFERAMPEEDFPAGLRLHRIDSAGHFFQQEQPDKVSELLIDWLRANPGGIGEVHPALKRR